MRREEQADEVKELSSSLSRMAMEAGVFATQLEVTLIGNDEIAEKIIEGDRDAFTQWLEEAERRYGESFTDLPYDVQSEMANVAVTEARENLDGHEVNGDDAGE